MIGTLPGSAIVLATMRERGLVKTVDHRPVLRLECQVMTPRQHPQRRRAIHGGHEQFVCPEVPVTRTSHGHIERSKNGCVKGLARRKVLNYQLDVVDQTTPMYFLRFHTAPLSGHSSAWRDVCAA